LNVFADILSTDHLLELSLMPFPGCVSQMPDGHRLRFDDGFHDYLPSGIHHRDRDGFFVNVHANKFRTFHYQVLLSS
jgi:hypothetical protein